MFEEELELEKKEGAGVGPLIIILALVALLVGGVGYIIYTNQQELKTDEAAAVLKASLESQGPALLKFHSGMVAPSVNEKPTDPHYRLLEKAGILKVKPGKGQAKLIDLTPDGQKKLAAFPEFKTSKEADGTLLYSVPLATKELVQVVKVTKISPSRSQVEFTWKWKPNEMGNVFDASGNLMKAFNTWDRGTLIQKYGADFYNADPQRMTVTLVKGSKGWQVATE